MLVERASSTSSSHNIPIQRPPGNRTLGIIPWILFIIGLCVLAGAVVAFFDAQSFQAVAQKAQGIIESVTTSTKRDKNGDYKTQYTPTVLFKPADRDSPIRFTGEESQYSDRYAIGKLVTVLYLPENPTRAKIDTNVKFWFVPLIIGVIGSHFVLIGGIWLAIRRRTRRRIERIVRTGTPVQAQIKAVERNDQVRVNNQRPFRIIARWHDPTTNQTHTFYSENLWSDPSSRIPGETITVFVDPRNPRHYYVDVSFLALPGKITASADQRQERFPRSAPAIDLPDPTPSTGKRVLFRLFPFFFLLAGLLMLAGMAFFLQDTLNFLADVKTAEGTVIEFSQSQSRDDDGRIQTMYTPVVRFIPLDGGPAITFKGAVASGSPAWERGATISVLYPPTAPEQARIDSFMELWFAPLIFGVMGSIFSLIGCFLMRSIFRKKGR